MPGLITVLYSVMSAILQEICLGNITQQVSVADLKADVVDVLESFLAEKWQRQIANHWSVQLRSSDAPDLASGGATGGGSSPSAGTRFSDRIAVISNSQNVFHNRQQMP